MFLVFANLFSRLDALDGRYQNLQNSIASVSCNVNNQISSITSRVEQILHSQNALTAEWTTDILNTDLAANTVTFSARAVPKTYREGIKVGLFRDKELLFWYEEEWKNVFVNGTPTQQLYYVRSEEVTLEQGRTYTQAAVVTDEYGRTKIYPGDSLVYEHGQWSHSGVTISQSADTSGWTF